MSIRWSKIANDSEDILRAASENFDCVELPVDFFMKIPDEQFISQKDLFIRNNIIPEVCSSILPANVFVTEKGFNLYAWTEYLKKAVKRLSDLGCRKMVWNNGRARVLPLEGDTGGMKSQILQFIHMLCDLSSEYGITILIEPLGPLRTNYLNSMREIEEFITLIPDDNLSSLVSLRGLEEIDLKIGQLHGYSGLIKHVYLENPLNKRGKRISPHSGDGYDYSSFLSALKAFNYDGVINLPEDADSETLQYCRTLV